jgi:hypothetical protein
MPLPHLVKRPLLAAFRRIVEWNLARDGREYRYVFILAHMRSGSTLLGHIIASHPDFMGAGETYTSYKRPADLQKLVPRTCELLRTLQLKGKFVVDKITMEQYLSAETLSSLPLHKCVIQIRDPKSTLKSLMWLFDCSQETALTLYKAQLATLEKYGKVLADRAILIRYDDLIERSQEALTALTRFFAVDPPFTHEYEKTKITGKMGDPSDNIRSGRIIRTTGYDYSIRKDLLDEGAAVYDKCQNELLAAGVQSACPTHSPAHEST